MIYLVIGFCLNVTDFIGKKKKYSWSMLDTTTKFSPASKTVWYQDVPVILIQNTLMPHRDVNKCFSALAIISKTS